MTKTNLQRALSVVLVWVAALPICPALLPAQEAATPPPAAVPPPAAAPPDLDFNIDTAEFEDFGEEDFVVEEQLDPKTDAAITAVKVVGGLVMVVGILWIVRKLVRGSRGRSPGAG